MEDKEKRALSTYPIPLPFWKMYVDDTLTALLQDKVQHFRQHLNPIETTIQFTIEMEAEGALSFSHTTLMDPCQPRCLGRAHTRTSTWASNPITPWHTRWQWPAPYSTVLRRSARTSQTPRKRRNTLPRRSRTPIRTTTRDV